jgi:DNA repair exonuclease SbcCD ATPase subunit
MRFQHVEIANFLSFGERQIVSLEHQGLLAVFGDNLDSKGADSNGAGKSTISEAIVWALYGETMRGYRGDDVVNRNVGKDCRVTLAVEDSGWKYLITRTRKASGKKPNDLTLHIIEQAGARDISAGTVADTQALIQVMVGMDCTTFTQAVMLSHGTRSFAQMTDREGKEVLEDIMRTSTLSAAQVRTKEKVVTRSNELAQINSRRQQLVDRIANEETRLNKLKADGAQHSAIIENRRLELISRRAELETQLDDIYTNTGLDSLISLRDHQISQLTMLENALAAIQTKEVMLAHERGDKLAELERAAGEIVGRMRQVEQDLQTFNELVGKPCPTCKQVLTPDAADACMQQWQAEIAKTKPKLKDLEKRKTKLDSQHKKAVGEFAADKAALEKDVSSHRGMLQGTMTAVHRRGNELRLICDYEQQAFNLNEEIEALDPENNPYQSLIDNAAVELTRFRKELRSAQQQAHVLEVQLQHLNFLVTAFGNQGLKSYLLDNVVPVLTERAQHYIDILSGGDITIRFATQTTLKTGSQKEQFQVQAVNRFGADVYAGNSEGEKRRVDLAVGWALGDLAATRASKAIRFKGLDEPFTNLDETGEDAVIRLLHSVASEYETIMVITHSAHLQSQFQNRLIVRKQNGLSRVV